MIKEITEENYEEIIGEGPVIVKFGTSWCGPCKQLAPIFEDVSENTKGVTFAEVSVEESERLSKNLGIRAVPTMILYLNGEEVDRRMGGGRDNLDALVEQATA